jgi:hypothetical protein
MNYFDTLTLQAFLLALPQLSDVLPEELHQEIQRVGQVVKNHEPGVADEVRSLVQRHDCLKEPYNQAYDHLQQQYKTQERVKGTLNLSESPTALDWEEMIVLLLTAEDFAAAAKNLLKQDHSHIRSLSDDTQIFLASLQRTVAELDAKAIAVLRALERRPFTVKGLVYAVGISLDQTWAIVQSLWKAGYIDTVTGNVLYRVFPMLRDRHRGCRAIDSDTYLTLTSKGHFLLHPFISLGQRGGITL